MAVPSLLSLKRIFEETSDYTGHEFFRQLVKQLADVLDVHGVWVTEYKEGEQLLNSLAFWLNGHYVEKYEYKVEGTPCEPVLSSPDICHVPDRVIELYPRDPDLKPLGAVSYMGIALHDENGRTMGHLALLDDKPMRELPEVYLIFRVFAARAAAEMRRLAYENRLKESESRLSRVFNGTKDAILELNQDLMIVQANEAASQLFKRETASMSRLKVSEILEPAAFRKLTEVIASVSKGRRREYTHWIQGYLNCIDIDGKSIPADASVSCYPYKGELYFALYLRDVQERLESEAEIRRLTAETTRLKEIVAFSTIGRIIGDSEVLRQTLSLVKQVAVTDTTVLITGETGTGKELIAKEIHDQSLRSNKPYIALNCAALPSELIESELFGHVKGAFTGATSEREGRFKLANGGTIFLDEIGELPLPLQAKLLRVIQEGEFEPVGSSFTQRVDVRIIAATHRDLWKCVKQNVFREDLYYRLNVFPVFVPPLRDRGDDIIILSEAFAAKFSERYGMEAPVLSGTDRQRLMNYHWPGNVRELQNVIERAVITGRLNTPAVLDEDISEQKPDSEKKSKKIYTQSDLEELEKENLLQALRTCKGKIYGADGAAALVAIPPTTFSSKLKKFGISTNAFS